MDGGRRGGEGSGNGIVGRRRCGEGSNDDCGEGMNRDEEGGGRGGGGVRSRQWEKESGNEMGGWKMCVLNMTRFGGESFN